MPPPPAAAPPPFSRLSSRVIRVMGDNPGPMTLKGTNTYLLGTARSRLLVDTGEGRPGWVAALRDAVAAASADLAAGGGGGGGGGSSGSGSGSGGASVSVGAVLLTHWHPDHVGGLADVARLWPGVRVYKAPRPGLEGPPTGFPLFGAGGAGGAPAVPLCEAPPPVICVDAETTVEVLPAPGHTDDHVCLWLREERALLTGDTVLGEGSCVFSCYHEYMRTLRALLERDPRRLYCAHGPTVEDGRAKIAEIIAHRQRREAQILQLLAADAEAKQGDARSDKRSEGGAGAAAPAGMSIAELVPLMYAETPRALWPAASINVLHHLKKLLKEGAAVLAAPPPVTSPDIMSDESDYRLFGEGAAETDRMVAEKVFRELRVALA